MPRLPGSPKTGGRVKGTPNKRTQFLTEVFEERRFDIPQLLIELYPQLSVDRKADFLLELMQYLYPKKKALVIDGDGEPRTEALFTFYEASMAPADRTRRIDELTAKQKLLGETDE